MSLRLACRTAVWPRNLESELTELWSGDSAGTYELVPLRRADVETAAKDNELNPDEFISELLRSNAVPLAIKPVTLDFLLRTFKKHRKLPSTQVELYDQGCRLLCEEPRKNLRPVKPESDSTAGQRLAVASRIAATTILCGRNAVWTDVDRGELQAEDIPLADLLGGKASWQTEQIEVGEGSIFQSLDTGLFSSRGLPRIGWAHQTYAEFLAARFLASNLTLEKITSLILDEDGKVIPQLYELSAWLAIMIPGLFRRLMITEPEFLLRSDAATADSRDKQGLADNLLSLFDQGEIFDFD